MKLVLSICNTVVVCRAEHVFEEFDFPADTLRGAVTSVGKRQGMTGGGAAGADGATAFPRSTSQPGNCRGSAPPAVSTAALKKGLFLV